MTARAAVLARQDLPGEPVNRILSRAGETAAGDTVVRKERMPIIIANAVGAGSAAAGLRRKGATRPDGARFSLDVADEAAPEAPAVVTLVCPTALLQIQEAPEREPARAAAVRRGADLLDRLDDLRLALVAGSLSPARLRALAETLAARREASHDPRLDEIIAEIELRTAVELAKFNRSKPR